MRNDYYLKDDTFVIEHYDRQKAFASFLPGIAGVDGIPMWVFYNNRGQGIAGFGIRIRMELSWTSYQPTIPMKELRQQVSEPSSKRWKGS